MIYENKEIEIPYILSDAAREAYEKIKALILRIFSLIKKQEKDNSMIHTLILQENWIRKAIMKNLIVIWQFVQCIID